MKYFEVVSGRPAGEMYHRDVVVTLTEEKAIAQVSTWREAIEMGEAPSSGKWEAENWLYGPGYYAREGSPADCLTWNGFDEVPAEIIG